MQKPNWLSLSFIGLTLGLCGAILLAFSVEIIGPNIPPPALTHATINKLKFQGGLFFLALGYVLQMLDNLIQENDEEYR